MARKKLGEMLIELGVIDEDALRAALADQRRWGRSLGRTLVEMKLLDEDVMVRVLAKQLHLDSVDVEEIDIPGEVLDLVPADLIRGAKVIPFRTVMKFLDVAMADPTNAGVIDELRIRTQLNIRPFLCGPRQIERVIERYFGDGSVRGDGIPFETADTFVNTVSSKPNRLASEGLPVTSSSRAVAAAARETRPIVDREGLRPYPRTIAPPLPGAPAAEHRDAEILALQTRIQKLEALVARDEEVLRKLLALLVDKGLATRDEIVSRLS